METKFIEEQKIKSLQDSIGFLDNYLPKEGEKHIVGDSTDEEKCNMVKTQLLLQLGEINKFRDYLILFNKK